MFLPLCNMIHHKNENIDDENDSFAELSKGHCMHAHPKCSKTFLTSIISACSNVEEKDMNFHNMHEHATTITRTTAPPPHSHLLHDDIDTFQPQVFTCMTTSSANSSLSPPSSSVDCSSMWLLFFNESSNFCEFHSRSMRGFIPHVSKRDSLRLEGFEDLLERHYHA